MSLRLGPVRRYNQPTGEQDCEPPRPITAGKSEIMDNLKSQSLIIRWTLLATLAIAFLSGLPTYAQDGVSDEPAPAETKSAIPSSPQEVITAISWPFALAFGVASVIALWCGIERLVLLRKRRVIPKAFVDRFLQHLRSGRMDKANAIAVCQQDGSPTADIFLHGVRKWGKPSVEVEQAVIDGGERQVSLLKKRLRLLNGIANITPLVGLLGTVIGMIKAFNDIANSNAMGQAEELATGIALALLTTAIGLLIAIPAQAVYIFLAGRIDTLVMEMDQLGQEIVYLISAEALRERGLAAKPSTSGQQRTSSNAPAAAKQPPPKKQKQSRSGDAPPAPRARPPAPRDR